MKKYRILSGLLAVLFAVTVLPAAAPARALGPSEVTVTVDGSSAQPLTGARHVGVNIEMSITSDEMWAADGNWMEQTLAAGSLSMMRWGYDAWAFNWETEQPLSPARYWGGLNTHDAAGTFGLREFIAFCKEYSVVPFVMIPLESLDTFGGEATLQQIQDLTASMARYIADQGIELCYFDMGNEVWNHGADGIDNARYLGGLYPEFQRIVKEANPNFRLVLQRAPENILWNRWNDTLVEAAGGAFDAYDDHRYAFYGWDKYFDKDGDDILTPGKPIEGKEAILGECNIGWTPVQDNWNAGHVRDLGGGMALLNALLDMVNREQYSQILTWPSQWPSKASIVNDGMDKGFGWFDLDAWYLTGDTQRFTGPVLAHRILNQNVLENKLNASSTASTVRVFSYENTAANDLRVIVINKWDPTTLTLQVPDRYTMVDAMVLQGESVWDTTPDYVSHLGAGVAVSGGVLQDAIPGECVVVYHFSAESSATVPAAPVLTSPATNAEGSTAQTFCWQAVSGAQNYHLVVSANPDLSDPVIDTYTGPNTLYQASRDLPEAAVLYWTVSAANAAGETAAPVQSFQTPGLEDTRVLTVNEDSDLIARSGGWNLQRSEKSYQGNDMSAEKAGEYAEFTFTGTQARILGIRGDWCGLAQVSVDGGEPVTVDTYSAQGQDQAILFDTGELAPGQHTVLLQVMGQKNDSSAGCWIEFDAVQILDSAGNDPKMDTAVWNEDDARVSRFSIWTHQTVAGCYHNDDLSSSTWKAHAEFTFTGTNAVLRGLKAPWCGTADISVDGTVVATVDTYAPQQENQAVWYDTGELPYGAHTIRITVNAAKNDASQGKWVEWDTVTWR